MYLKNLFLLIILFVTGNSVSVLTGPSTIDSEIRPISINEKGEVLCRTRFTKNEMGAQRSMKIEYGYCIVTKDSIIEFKTHELNPDAYPVNNYNAFNNHVEYWDSVFESCFKKNNLCYYGNDIAKDYGFESCNIEYYKLDKIIQIEEFENIKKVNLGKNKQIALQGGRSTKYCEEKYINILYDFGHFVILKNKIISFEDNQSIGADFDYYNPYTNENKKVINIGFEMSEINGILFIK